MPRPPIYREEVDRSEAVPTNSVIHWTSTPVKEFHMKGGKYRYMLVHTVYVKTEDETALSLRMDLRSGWRGSEGYHLLAYRPMEGIGNRMVPRTLSSLMQPGDEDRGFLIAYWDTYPSDKTVTETIYHSESLR